MFKANSFLWLLASLLTVVVAQEQWRYATFYDCKLPTSLPHLEPDDQRQTVQVPITVEVSISKITVVYDNRTDTLYLSVVATRMYYSVDHGMKMGIVNVSKVGRCIDGGSWNMIIVIVRMWMGIPRFISKRLIITM
jgi:hypothetical protein